MRRRLITAAVTAAAVAACTIGTPAPTASVPAATASPTAVPAPPTITGSPPSTTTTAPSVEPSPVGVSCAGDDLLWELLPPPAQAYALAWIEGEQSERLALLEEGMTADGSFAEPATVGRVSGLPAIAEHIGVFQTGREHEFFRVRAWAPTDEHHGYVRARWMLCHTDGPILLEGEDILVLDESGLIREATRFVGP